MDKTEPTQADREAAINLQTRPGSSTYIPLDVLTEAFARHRLEALSKHDDALIAKEVSQNDRMRGELAHIGNTLSGLERAMCVDPARDDGSWPGLADRIEKLRLVALTRTDVHDPALKQARDALRKSKEGWDNAVEIGILPPQHHATARGLSEQCSAALANLNKLIGEG